MSKITKTKISISFALLSVIILFGFRNHIEYRLERYLFNQAKRPVSMLNTKVIPHWADVLLSEKQKQDALKQQIAPAIMLVIGEYPLQMVWIPAGSFQMGSPDSERHREINEGPQRRVTLSKGYYMGIYEITLGQFRQFVTETGYVAEADKRGKDFRGHFGGKHEGIQEVTTATWQKALFKQTEDCPVNYVTWNDARAFCDWLSKKTAKVYRLPTEAEWEYACRAGSITRFSFGYSDEILGQYAWYKENSSDRAHPVGTKKPNGWGLFDMHGNVYEWCFDLYDTYPEGDVIDPKGAAIGIHRVYRGGCWKHDAWAARSANRGKSFPDYRYHRLGFRVVREK